MCTFGYLEKEIISLRRFINIRMVLSGGLSICLFEDCISEVIAAVQAEKRIIILIRRAA